MLVLALSTGHKVGLGTVGAAFILFALASAMLIPRFRPQFPGRGLPAFVVVVVLFFVGMMTAVEVFGAEPKEKKEHAAQPATSVPTVSSSTTQTTSTPTIAPPPPPTTTTVAKPPPKPQIVQVTEKEFRITLATTSLKAGPVTFEIKNTGKLQHDLAIEGGPKTKLISAGGTLTLTTTLKAGPLELYCTVPGHKKLGMDVKLTVS